jgi:hypothetical protein
MNAPNPYEPPKARSDAHVAPLSSDFGRERRSVLLCIVLSALSLGLYSGIWLIRRRPFLNALHASKKLGSALPVMSLGLGAIGLVVSVSGKDGAPISQLASTVAGIATLVANFRVAAILRSEFSRTGRFLSVSSVGTFFFGIYYLQYKINQGADTPPRVVDQPR